MSDKLFIVRKFIKAESLSVALEKERSLPPDEIYLDADWKKQQKYPTNAIGFDADFDEEVINLEQ